jgi:hypothetical protein
MMGLGFVEYILGFQISVDCHQYHHSIFTIEEVEMMCLGVGGGEEAHDSEREGRGHTYLFRM